MELVKAKCDIFRNVWLLPLMLLSLVIPEMLKRYDVVYNVYKTLGMGCLGILFCNLLWHRPRTRLFGWTGLFYGIIVGITLINGGSLWTFFVRNYDAVAMCLLFALVLENEPKLILRASRILEVYVYINLLCMLLFPEGAYNLTWEPHWFLGHKNSIVRIVLPIMCMAIVRSLCEKKKIDGKTWFLAAGVCLSIWRTGSATSLIGLVTFFGCLLLSMCLGKKCLSWMTLWSGFLATSVGAVMIIVFQVQKYFTFFVVDILGKDITINNRTTIWNSIMEFVFKKPIVGYGYLSFDQYVEILDHPSFTHPHNFLLYLMMTGGILLLLSFMVGVAIASKSIKENSQALCNRVILFVWYAFFLMGLVESLNSSVLMYPMLLMGMKADVWAAMSEKQEQVVG